MASGGNNARPIKCLDTGEVFRTMLEASRKYGLSSASISNVCNGKTQTCGGMHWAYTDDITTEKQQKIKIARELCYGKEVVDRLRQAKTSHELDRIMKSARLGKR